MEMEMEMDRKLNTIQLRRNRKPPPKPDLL